MSIVRPLFLLVLLTGIAWPTFGQEVALPRLFLDCDACDESYFQREINFVRHVRDQADADLYVLVTAQQTGGGGTSYVLAFQGRGAYEGITQTLRYATLPSDTDDEEREGLLQVMRMGAMPYLSQTPFRDQFDIGYDAEGAAATETTPADDPWNRWVAQLDVGGALEAEESQEEFGFEGGIRLTRITDRWKTILDGDIELQRDVFDSDEGTIESTAREIDSDYTVVRSLTAHWSTGLISELGSTTFNNQRIRARTAPAIEYNLFPWSESDRRVMALAYFAGVQHYSYFDETLFGKTNETLGFHSMRLTVDFIQPWGEIFAQVEGRQFLHDLSKNSLEIESALDLRITRGLSVVMGTQIQLIHDQLFLSAEGASLEEVLLRRRQLATNFQLELEIGLRFTFGSIYNAVVNERL